jgi:hypothetical protein
VTAKRRADEVAARYPQTWLVLAKYLAMGGDRALVDAAIAEIYDADDYQSLRPEEMLTWEQYRDAYLP